MSFRPMLAADANLSVLRLPVLASFKLDGVRAITHGGLLLSRSGKIIPNEFIQRQFQHFAGLDGELIAGDPRDPAAFRNTMSAVMTVGGEPDVKFYAFDRVSDGYLDYPFHRRLETIAHTARVVRHNHVLITTYTELEAMEQSALEAGYEGLILRDPMGVYKNGRSTVKEGGMLKLKRFLDSEAVVIGFQERLHNANESKLNALGYTERSSHQENMVGRGDLGALLVRDNDVEFAIGTGFDDAARELIWEGRDYYLGRTVKYKFFPSGSKDKPRFPVFLGFRATEDLS